MKVRLALIALAGLLFGGNAFAQKDYGATPEDSVKCVESISLYSEYYKQDAFTDAYPYLVEAIQICPKASKNHYIKGVNIVRALLKAEKDETREAQLLDTLMWVYDMRAESFGEKGYVLGRKGTDMLRYGKAAKAYDAYQILKEGFELSQNETEAGALAAYYQAAYYSVATKKMDKAVLLETYPSLAAVLSYQKKQNGGTLSKSYAAAEAQINEIFSKVASCEDLVEIYTPKFEANKTDKEVLSQIMELFEKRGCTDEDLFLNASIEADKVMPSATAKLSIGAALIKKERYSEAVGYLSDAAATATENEDKEKAYLYLAKAQLATKNYPAVKSAALKLLQVNPNSGEAYFLIGDAYFYGSSTVGENDCEKNGGKWASISKYYRAKELDSSLAEKVNGRLGAVSSRYPTKEDCFFYGITDGQSITVGGWINETVTVKTQ